MTGARIPGGLTLEKRIGEGALGEVWRARQEGHGEPVAVKLLSPGSTVASSDDLHRRFAVEARAAKSVDHPNAVRVLSDGTTESGTPFVVMELLEGETLASWLSRERRLSLELVAQLIDSVGAALDAVHAARIIHRDVKPQNVFVASGPLFKLIDFGSAKHLDDSAAARVPGRRTDPDIVVGTPAYLSPEMVTKPSAVDHRADLWALAVTAYKCLTGELPFPGQDLVEVCTNIMMGRMRRPSRIAPGLPEALDAWFTQVFAQELEARPASGAQMARSFREAIGDVEKTRITRLPRRRARWPRTLGAAALGAALATVFIAATSRTSSLAPAFPALDIGPIAPLLPPFAESEVLPAVAPPLAPSSLRGTLDRLRVVVASGSFLMGCLGHDEDCAEDEGAAREVVLPAFAIDRFEVSVLAYARCVHAGACSDDGLRGVQLPDAPFTVSPRCNWGSPQRLQHPLNCVTFEQAATYCRWVGGRLPSEAEWEKAARGDEPRIFPWGDDPPSCKTAVMHSGASGCRAEGTWPIGSKRAGASPSGIHDLAGNVSEWVSGMFHPARPEMRVARGGGWPSEKARALRVSARESFEPDHRSLHVGFRCASDPPAP